MRLFEPEDLTKMPIIFDELNNQIENVLSYMKIGLKKRYNVFTVIRIHPHAIL